MGRSLNDGEKSHWYRMDDQEFLSAIEKGESFGKHHILVCEVLMTQQLQPDGQLKLDYAVKRVLNHIIPGQQMPFTEQ